MRRDLALLFCVLIMSCGWLIILATFSYLAIILLIRAGFRGLDVSIVAIGPYDLAASLLFLSSLGLAIRSVLRDPELLSHR